MKAYWLYEKLVVKST